MLPMARNVPPGGVLDESLIPTANIEAVEVRMGTVHPISGWWSGTFFIFPYVGNNHPNKLIFFRGVETTDQIFIGFLLDGFTNQ